MPPDNDQYLGRVIATARSVEPEGPRSDADSSFSQTLPPLPVESGWRNALNLQVPLKLLEQVAIRCDHLGFVTCAQDIRTSIAEIQSAQAASAGKSTAQSH